MVTQKYMPKIFLFFLTLILLAGDTELYAGQDGGVHKRVGSLADVVKKASENLVRRDSEGFKVPTAGELKAWRFIVESIFAGKPADADKMIKQLSFPYELSRFTDKSAGREYFLLEEAVPLKFGWGLYVFDPKSRNPLAIEIPHPVFDSNTEFQGIDAFLQTNASAYLLAGAHRRANKQDTPCTQPKSSDAVKYPVSDVAHAVATPFHAVHEALLKVRPTIVAVQLHGMAEREICPNAFLSNGSPNVTTNSKRLLSCLTKSGVDAEIFDGNTTCPLIALTNVQGRFSNGETKDPCGTDAKKAPGLGAFIHIEQEPVIRRDRKSWQGVIDGLKCAFPAAPQKSSAFVLKRQDDPEFTLFSTR